MKKLILLICCISGPTIAFPLVAQDTQTQTGQIYESKSHSVFKGLFLKVWGKLKSVNPTQKQSAKVEQVYAAGIRGAESADTLLKPYWKDDLSQDQEFQTELQLFSNAQLNLDKGELEDAVKEFDTFIDKYQQSSLRPNALFARSIGLAGIGKKDLSTTSMQLFLDENPNHPLIDDAREILSELSK